jgi:Ca-activated chloride channel homolog
MVYAMNNELTWGSPEYLVYVPLLVVVPLLLGYAFMRRKKAVALLASGTLRNRFILHYSPVRQIIKAVLFCLGVAFLFCVLLQPQWNKKEEYVKQEGRDLFIALDVSGSMRATDVAPNRLEFAKQKIRQLLQHLSCERVGLILFSGSTYVQCPLTDDYGAFFMFLDQIDVETIYSGSTALDQAIKQALCAFEAIPERKHKLLVLLTDGEDFSTDLSGVKQEALQAGMHIFALGIGSAQGAPIPLFDHYGNPAGHQKDSKGTVVISRLNEPMLATLAESSGGMYIHAVTGSEDVKQLVRAVEQFEKEKFDDKKIVTHEQQYVYCAAASFLCLLIEWLL